MKYRGFLDLRSLEELLPAVLFGAEGEGDDDGDNNDAGNDDQDDNDDAGSDDESGSEHDDADDPKVKGLKAALAAERKRADAAEKRAKAETAKAAKDKAARELAEKSEIEQAQAREQAANEKAQKLAAGLLRRDIEAAISKAASAAGFIDVDDAIAGVERGELDFSQDEDDPTDITIDYKSVEAAVKKLATKKPHFLSKGTDDGEPTGGQFGRGNSKKKRTTEDVYKERYPSLRG